MCNDVFRYYIERRIELLNLILDYKGKYNLDGQEPLPKTAPKELLNAEIELNAIHAEEHRIAEELGWNIEEILEFSSIINKYKSKYNLDAQKPLPENTPKEVLEAEMKLNMIYEEVEKIKEESGFE